MGPQAQLDAFLASAPGHAIAVERPDEWAAAISDFLR